MTTTTTKRLIARFSNSKTASTALPAIRALFEDAAGADVVLVNDSIGITAPRKGDVDLGKAKSVFEDNDAIEVGEEENGSFLLTATFRLPMGKPGDELAKELHKFFDQTKTISSLAQFKTAPFGEMTLKGDAKDVALVHDGSLYEFLMPASSAAIDVIKKFLMAKKVEQMKLRLCGPGEHARITKAAAAVIPPKPFVSAFASNFAVPAELPAEKKKKPAVHEAFADEMSDEPVVTETTSDGLQTVGRRFLFTGKLATLVRDDAKKRVQWLGGVSASSVSKELDYLVVGDDGSPLYGAGAKGSKILAVEKLIAHGEQIKIISEKQFLELKRR